jgi:hypothetical protein
MNKFTKDTTISHYFRYFKFENGPEIIASLKCGTRFIENQTTYPPPPFCSIDISEFQNYVTKDTIFVYRDVVEHMLSGLVTDYALNSKFSNLNEIVNEYISNKGTHWISNTYLKLYSIWNDVGFKFINLNDLSTLFPNTTFNSSLYEHKNMVGIKKLTDILKFIPNDKRNQLMEVAGWDSMWLDRMLRGQRDSVSISEYNELRDKYKLLLSEYDELRKGKLM